MGKELIITRLISFSEENNKIFNENFIEGLNIIRGKNTSGKSTIFQSILYTFGINDIKDQLSEILSEKVIFRVDFNVSDENCVDRFIIIRDYETIYIKQNNTPIEIFIGINGNSSTEHIKLKQYINNIFNCNLMLQSNNEFKLSPIEVLFLPYYISQTLGWIYLRKSFSSLDFYKNFKFDYLDYYFGINDNKSRGEIQKITTKLKKINNEINFISKISNDNKRFKIAKLNDEGLVNESIEFIKSYSKNKEKLQKYEKDYVIKCNELSFQQQRLNKLRVIFRNQKKQSPDTNNCPTCGQNLPFSIEAYYKYSQELNDTNAELELCKTKLKDFKSMINSILKNINVVKTQIEEDKTLLQISSKQNINFENWIDNKAQIKLNNNIENNLGSLELEKSKLKEELKLYTDEDIASLRLQENKYFKKKFQFNLKELKVKIPTINRFLNVYDISAFPSQGVELHKTILAYHFAFNESIKKNRNIHRFPFFLDSIFNEDIDFDNKKNILKFINKNRPNDTQTFIAISETKTENDNIDEYIEIIFDKPKKTITMGQAIRERSFLRPIEKNDEQFIYETINIMDSIN